MPIVLFFVVPAALVMAEFLPAAPLPPSLTWPAAALAMALAPAIYAWQVARRRDRGLAHHERRHRWLWIGASAAVLGLAQWPRWVRHNLGLEGAIFVDEALILLPVVLPWALSRIAVDWAWRRGRHPCQVLSRSLRHAGGELALPVGLALLVTTLSDVNDRLGPAERQFGAAALCVALAAGILILLPLALRILWGAYPLPPGELRTRLEHTSRQVGLNAKDLLVWPTTGQSVNAAVAGALPICRYVFLTDGLLKRLEADEIEAVLLHEAAHVRRRHLAWRLAIIAAPAVAAFLWQAVYSSDFAALSAWLGRRGLSEAVQSNLLWPSLFLSYALAALSWCSRRLEHDADLWACRALVDVRHRSAGPSADAPWACYFSALRKMAASGVDGGPLHPTVEQRLAFLDRRLSDRAPAPEPMILAPQE